MEKVWQAVSKGNPSADAKIYRTSIEAMVGVALQTLADRVMEEGLEKRALLQKSFSFTLSGGATSIISSNSTLLIDSVPQSGYVLLSGITDPLCWLPERADLNHPPALPDFTFYSIFGGQILVRDYTGAVPSATALTVYGNYVPTISEVPDPQLVDDFIAIGVQIASKGPQ